ncbi:Centrosomal protein [Armadillidium vulgare]|nr:Centrosomal protein [Armadillidium vulgare]
MILFSRSEFPAERKFPFPPFSIHFKVAIVALNILGNEVEDNNNSVSPDGEGGKVPSQRDSKGDTPLKQDLAFTMYVDSHVAEVITQMEIKREKAKKDYFIYHIQYESFSVLFCIFNSFPLFPSKKQFSFIISFSFFSRFLPLPHLTPPNFSKSRCNADKRQEYAKKLQATIDQLRIAGEKIGKFEIEKRQAIDNENFDRAKLKKKQIEEYREIIYQHYNVDELLEVKGIY